MSEDGREARSLYSTVVMCKTVATFTWYSDRKLDEKGELGSEVVERILTRCHSVELVWTQVKAKHGDGLGGGECFFYTNRMMVELEEAELGVLPCDRLKDGDDEREYKELVGFWNGLLEARMVSFLMIWSEKYICVCCRAQGRFDAIWGFGNESDSLGKVSGRFVCKRYREWRKTTGGAVSERVGQQGI